LPKPFKLADTRQAMADAIPSRAAVVTNDREIDFAEIDERSARLASHLRSLEVGPGDHMAVHSWNRIEWVIDRRFTHARVLRGLPARSSISSSARVYLRGSRTG
jgi:non-ribosomal peptide synthetase component E (peptide arylation enzyme)